MKYSLTILCVLLGALCFANMSSPFWEGTHSASAFSSRDIDIQKEKIHLTIARDFMTASYVIEYFIKTDSAGKQIPLLFLAKDYKADFKVWVDNREIKLSGIPFGYLSTKKKGLKNFRIHSLPAQERMTGKK